MRIVHRSGYSPQSIEVRVMTSNHWLCSIRIASFQVVWPLIFASISFKTVGLRINSVKTHSSRKLLRKLDISLLFHFKELPNLQRNHLWWKIVLTNLLSSTLWNLKSCCCNLKRKVTLEYQALMQMVSTLSFLIALTPKFSSLTKMS